MKSGAKGAKKIFRALKLVEFFFTKCMSNDYFSEPPRRADSKNPILFSSRFLGLGHLQGLGVKLGRILGILSIEPFLGEGGVPETKTRPPLASSGLVAPHW